MIFKVSRRDKIKITVEINEIENRTTIGKKISETKNWLFFFLRTDQ